MQDLARLKEDRKTIATWLAKQTDIPDDVYKAINHYLWSIDHEIIMEKTK
jgi:hypothetical protein